MQGDAACLDEVSRLLGAIAAQNGLMLNVSFSFVRGAAETPDRKSGGPPTISLLTDVELETATASAKSRDAFSAFSITTRNSRPTASRQAF